MKTFPDQESCEIYQYAYEIYKKENSHKSVVWIDEEFQEDYQRFWCVIGLLVRYQNSGNLNVQLLFNHLMICSNTFGKGLAEILLKLVIEKENYEVITYTLSLLYFLGYVPDNKMMNIMGEDYLLTEIPIDMEFIKILEVGLENIQTAS